MNTYQIFEYLLELAQETSKELIRIYYNKKVRETLIIFPKKRDKRRRISEQELRFVLTNLHGKFSHPNLFYSAETPTEKKYSFNGKGERSASSDVSFYHAENKKLNIEFKAKNPKQQSIDKDIEKLIKEPCLGAWFHILENENTETIETLFKKFRKSFPKFSNPVYPISFHILILKGRILLSRKGKDSDIGKINYQDIFNIKYSNWNNLSPGKHQFRNGILIDSNSKNTEEDWQIDKFDLDEI